MSEDVAKAQVLAAREVLPRVGLGVRFWCVLIVAEALAMALIVMTALDWAEAYRYSMAAALLIGGTAFCSLSVFAAWYRQHAILRERMAAEHEQALARKAEAEAQARQKSRLLATMSHEIRTPLNGVIGMLGLMLETALTPEQKNYASIAHGSARSLLSFLDEILDTARAESRQTADGGSTSLLPLIETVAELMAPRAHAKGIGVSTYVAPGVPDALPVSGLHLRQILFNLAGNAVKFTETGGIAIEAHVTIDRVVLHVRDTGIGMNADEAARVFAEFEQANADTQRRYGGTGLGLAISRRLAENMGGSLTVSSRKGEGTTFTLSLPVSSELAVPEPEKPLAGRRYGLWLQPGFAAEHLARKLQDLGAETLYPGEAGLDVCHALICDPQEARSLLALRKAAPEKAHVALWVLLNPEDRRALKDVLQQPATGYLVKPVRASSLVALLTGQDQAAIASGVAGLRKVAANARKTPGLRLLLVDDTAVNLLLASTMLRRSGHDVVTATSGAEVLERLAAGERFDAIMMDIEMPRMDGHETARRIRAAGHEALPIMALTANTAQEDIEACLAAGMNGHLSKPFDQQDLDEALARLTRPRAA